MAFIEGIITFVSPCLLPLLPAYLSYFAAEGDNEGSGEQGEGPAGAGSDGERAAPGGASGAGRQRRTVLAALCFIAGFTVVFALLGVFAGAIGGLLARWRSVVNLVCGVVMALFGLSYLGLFRLPFFRGGVRAPARRTGRLHLWRSFVFGLSFSLAWTPCIGVFLGSALALAASRASWLEGLLLLLCYAAGLGLPLLLAALLIAQLRSSLSWLKRHNRLITRVSGALLVIVGILLAAGWLGTWVARLNVVNW